MCGRPGTFKVLSLTFHVRSNSGHCQDNSVVIFFIGGSCAEWPEFDQMLAIWHIWPFNSWDAAKVHNPTKEAQSFALQSPFVAVSKLFVCVYEHF